jgi:hypothetical protein
VTATIKPDITLAPLAQDIAIAIAENWEARGYGTNIAEVPGGHVVHVWAAGWCVVYDNDDRYDCQDVFEDCPELTSNE